MKIFPTLLLIPLAACAYTPQRNAPPVRSAPPCSSCAGRNVRATALVGTWRAVEYVAWDSTASAHHLFGSPPSGYAVFDPAGNAFVQIMRQGDAPSLAAYYGPYTVNTAGDSLSIRVEGSNLPGYLATVQRRPFSIRGDTLLLGVPGRYLATLVKVMNR